MRGSLRYLIAAVLALFTFITYYCNSSQNEITGETQHVSLSTDEEIALGLQAAPQMAQQHGGLSQDAQARAVVDRVGQQIVQRTKAGQSPYQFKFHLLADPNTINAFALPGGQVFITEGMLRSLKTEGELAGVLAHEIGHVVARHSAEQIAKAKLTQGLSGAAAIAAYDPDRPATASGAAVAAVVSKLLTLRYGRDDELEADKLAVDFAPQAGYDPRAMIKVMEILDQKSGGSNPPEFLSTHPNPSNRIGRLQEEIAGQFPQGVPGNLKQ